MSESNRVQIASVVESTLGTTPTTPRMRLTRFTSGDPQFKRVFVDPDEIRSDRMLGDPIPVMAEADVNLGFELHFPLNDGPMSNRIKAALFSAWVNTPEFFNDGTADSIITQVNAGTDGFVVPSGGTAFVVGHLFRASGFTNSGNNATFRVTTTAAALITVAGAGLTAETAPPGTAKIKVCGLRCDSGDVNATSTGLASTTTVFTAYGLAVGMWIRIGGSQNAEKFATAALNSYARVIGVTATALTLDNLPVGWTTDAGAGKAIKIWFGDYIKNGTTKTGESIEFGYLAQTTPTYVLCKGQIPNTLEFNITSRQKITGSCSYMGMEGALSTTAQDASPDAVSTERVMAANAYVNRMSEGGSKLVSPNCAREFSISINNNLRKLECVDDDAPIGINAGEFMVTGRLSGYYGSDAIYTKYLAGTPTSLSSVIERNSQAVIFDVPRATYRDGSPAVTGKNTDVMFGPSWQASAETDYFNASLIINRLPYVES